MTNTSTQDQNKNAILGSDGQNDAQNVIQMPRHWMNERRLPFPAKYPSLINANQTTSINAMITYVAAKAGQSEYIIERRLSDHFRIANAKLLATSEFDDAIRFLADIVTA